MTEALTLPELVDSVLEQNGKTVRKTPKWESDAMESTRTIRRLSKPALSLREKSASESAVRMLVVDVLTGVFGYDKYDELSTEHRDRDLADIVVSLDGTATILVEVKKAGQRLTERQVTQVADYAKKAGIPWVVLTNGVHWQVHRLGDSPSMIFDFDLESMDKQDFEHAVLLHRSMVRRDRLNQFWQHMSALSPVTLRQVLASDRVVNAVRLEIKSLTGVNPEEIEIREALAGYGRS